MTGDEVGHARGKADARGDGSSQGHGDPRIHGGARGVRDADHVEAVRLAEARHALRVLGSIRPEEEPDAHTPPLRVWRADSRASRRDSSETPRACRSRTATRMDTCR